MGDYTPKFLPGASQSWTTSAAVTGGQVLVITGSGTVGPSAGASASVIGVAAHDAASGARVTVYVGGVQELVNTGGITAGAQVDSAASGQVASHTNGTTDYNAIGLALTTATTGNKLFVLMYRG